MSLKEREEAILSYLQTHREASVAELAHALFVSEPTVRRDLAALGRAGKLLRMHGGAVLRKQEPWENLPLSYREREAGNAKETIARRCLSLLQGGETVMIDASSTAFALLRLLGDREATVILTNSAKAPLVLSEAKTKLLVSGGELAPNTFSYVGSYAEDFFRTFHADICFFSVRTLTEDGYLTDNAVAENSLRKIMLQHSRRKILMLDSGKLGAPCLHTLCHMTDVDAVVSELDLSDRLPAYKNKLLF